MEFINLNAVDTLSNIDTASATKTQLLFKHSTRCSISVTAKNRLDKAPQPQNADCYYLDLLQYRDISNAIAEKFKVHHESPQVILINKGEATYVESHLGIEWDDIEEQLKIATS
jgi:bacillithiol system protein YtxJ